MLPTTGSDFKLLFVEDDEKPDVVFRKFRNTTAQQRKKDTHMGLSVDSDIHVDRRHSGNMDAVQNNPSKIFMNTYNAPNAQIVFIIERTALVQWQMKGRHILARPVIFFLIISDVIFVLSFPQQGTHFKYRQFW